MDPTLRTGRIPSLLPLNGSSKEVAMTTYLLLLNWTDQGIRNIKESLKRLDAAKKLAKGEQDGVRNHFAARGGPTCCSPPSLTEMIQMKMPLSISAKPEIFKTAVDRTQ